MAQYAVMIFERVAPADLPPEVMQGHMDLPARIAEHGGRVVAGLGPPHPDTATAIPGGAITDGPVIETKEILRGGYVPHAPHPHPPLAPARVTPLAAGGG